ncbi:actin filament-associated protein 1-like 2 isoform X2 [Denticeps clupeoides]|uniref:actin filament-associated protein 1-like 2 isoform X2 n=1 Tax=Denticeps clupeoides TaxID=299321 RepID=UPI0010A4AA16|nr:actin filament-associated protein 1-like 2 isoform X2 [Denticeps clupeoides]
MDKNKVLERLLEELQRFLKLLDAEKLSGNATVQKDVITDLLHSYRANGGDEEYIYMNKVIVTNLSHATTDRDLRLESDLVSGPQKTLPELPPPRSCIIGREPFPLPPVPVECPEGYYEEAQPYNTSNNDLGCFGLVSGARSCVEATENVVYAVIMRDDADAVSSSYESYDEEEVSKGKSAAQHQWPSTEASIELMKDARICAFLWRKKWLGQWAKQLCVIRENRLLCYKSSKDQIPLLDVSLVGCSVVYKEKQLKRKEHKLKIIPQGGETIVLGLQSKEQTEQWLKVIQDISPKSTEGSEVSDSSRLACTKVETNERYSVASESGSSTDSHAETLEAKDVKKKSGPGLKFSNLMNIGKKKISALESPEKCVDTSGYLNVLVNSQWRTRWCNIKNGQLWFFQDKGKTKMAQQPVLLEGCMVLPDPSPEHLYSFRIQMEGEELATLEAKSSNEMGHWLGLLLSQTGSKMDPEELVYDYISAERISSIVNAAKTSLYLMQRRYSEPNTYTDSPPSDLQCPDDIYDDVPSPENEQEEAQENAGDVPAGEQDSKDQLYVDVIPLRSFLHTSTGPGSTLAAPQPPPREASPSNQDSTYQDVLPAESQYESSMPTDFTNHRPSPDPPAASNSATRSSSQNVAVPSLEMYRKAFLHSATAALSPPSASQTPHTNSPRSQSPATSGCTDKNKSQAAACTGSIEVKLGKNRTEADLRRYTDEHARLEKEKEEVKSCLAKFRKERRQLKEELKNCQDSKQACLEVSLKQNEEACREAEHRRVEVELQLVEVKENLRKVEAGPFTLGTTVDSSLLEPPTPKHVSVTPPTSNGDASPVNSATALKNRPLSIMASKGNVLQKAKEWEKKTTT